MEAQERKRTHTRGAHIQADFSHPQMRLCPDREQKFALERFLDCVLMHWAKMIGRCAMTVVAITAPLLFVSFEWFYSEFPDMSPGRSTLRLYETSMLLAKSSSGELSLTQKANREQRSEITASQ